MIYSLPFLCGLEINRTALAIYMDGCQVGSAGVQCACLLIKAGHGIYKLVIQLGVGLYGNTTLLYNLYLFLYSDVALVTDCTPLIVISMPNTNMQDNPGPQFGRNITIISIVGKAQTS